MDSFRGFIIRETLASHQHTFMTHEFQPILQCHIRWFCTSVLIMLVFPSWFKLQCYERIEVTDRLVTYWTCFFFFRLSNPKYCHCEVNLKQVFYFPNHKHLKMLVLSVQVILVFAESLRSMICLAVGVHWCTWMPACSWIKKKKLLT